MQVKSQATLETAILFAFSLLLIVGFISYAIIVNNHNLQYETTPFVLSSLKFYNFQTMGSTCSFDFEFQTNTYLPYPKYELTFILNNGQRIVPDYGIYTETVIPVLSNGYQYTFVSNGVPNYNGSVCSVMGQQSVNHAYVKYVSYKNANGKTIVQPVSTNYVFQINSASTIPSQLYNNNTIFITGSVIPYSGYVYINYQNGTAVSGSPFTLGEYIYLPTGNYTLSYTNETYPVSFQYWSSSGGVIIQSTFASTTNMIVINNGEIYLNLRNLLKPSETFIIYSNKTYSTIPGKFNITTNFTKNGFYTYYVNNKPYTGCENVSQTSCIMTFSTAGTYTISATFKNSTTFAKVTPIQVYVSNPLSATLSSNETVAQNKTNVLLSVSTNGGLQPFTYSFYVNNTPIQNCIRISSPTCVYNIDNPPNDYVYNYTFTANVSDVYGELVTTNNVIVEGVVYLAYTCQNIATYSNGYFIISSSQTLKQDLICNNLIIEPGVTLTSNGYSIILSGSFINYGTIDTGSAYNGGFMNGGNNYPNSYGGSGGGGPGDDTSGGAPGLSTIAPGGAGGSYPNGNGGNGSTPPPPQLNNSIIKKWYTNGMWQYLIGAGGNSNPYQFSDYGGAGGYGIYIQANSIFAGTINANGYSGATDAGNVGTGGGGGGVILLAYGSGGYTQGIYNVNGGGGTASSYFGGGMGGNGGNGQVLTYHYTASPILVK